MVYIFYFLVPFPHEVVMSWRPPPLSYNDNDATNLTSVSQQHLPVCARTFTYLQTYLHLTKARNQLVIGLVTYSSVAMMAVTARW